MARTDPRQVERFTVIRVGVATVAVLVFLLAPEAAASPPAGTAATCPGKYQPMTREEAYAQAATHGIPQAQADAAFNSVNLNGDLWICQKGTPPGEPGFNWTDNQALGRDR